MLSIFSATQIKRIEELTCLEKGISSFDLMEKAADVFFNWFINKYKSNSFPIYIFCGNGNNGGDGLAIGRKLAEANFIIHIYLINISAQSTQDNLTNRKKLLDYPKIHIQEIHPGKFILPNIDPESVLIDAILGTGVNRPIDEKWKNIFESINSLHNFTISIDLPSGLPTDDIITGICIKADLVFGFEFPKLSYLLPENSEVVRKWMISSIDLSKSSIQSIESSYLLSEKKDFTTILKVRNKYSYKNNFGHLLLIASSKNMCGASILSATAALRSGCGLLTVLTHEACHKDLFVSLPEAILYSLNEFDAIDLTKFQSVAIGPGMKSITELENIEKVLFGSMLPLVLDAEAINLLGKIPYLLDSIPPNSILTPHVGEFEQLTHMQYTNSTERISACINLAVKYKLIIILKGAYTAVVNSNGTCYFNSSGNQGMATAGSGDVLTGILGSLLAQGYSPIEAARFGVFLHGLAGDLALSVQSYESLIATDIINSIGLAFKHLVHFEQQ